MGFVCRKPYSSGDFLRFPRLGGMNPMNEIQVHDAIAEILSDIWNRHQAGDFESYILRTCGVAVSSSPLFESIFISKAEEGSIERDFLKSAVKWWKVDDAGFGPCGRPSQLTKGDDPENIKNGFYRWPTLRFFVEGDRVLIGEMYGPSIFARKTGTLSFVGDNLEIRNVQVICNCKDLI